MPSIIATAQVNLQAADIVTFAGYMIAISVIGWWFGRRETNVAETSSDYFLAGRTLPWYVVGSSYIAANISTEHFIGMIGAAMIYGICVATPEWSCIIAFTFLIWIFIPFLLSAKVFTAPEFLEKRFNPGMRNFFATVTVVANVIAFLAPVIYGGGLALNSLLGWNLTFCIALIGLTSGVWAIWGGLKSVAWMDLLTIVIMVGGGLIVTYLGLLSLGQGEGLVAGFQEMVTRNQAQSGVWKEALDRLTPGIVPGHDTYNRLSVIQPLEHETTPWPHWVMSFFYIGLWYLAINQFMVQRILAAKNMYHARMGIVFAGYLKLLLPFIVVVPGLIYFAMHPEILLAGSTLAEVRPEADKTYTNLIRDYVPVGIKGILMAALFGAIQSTVSAVLASTSTVITFDFYRRHFRPNATDQATIRFGRLTTSILLVASIALGVWISGLKSSLFVYIQQLFMFFAPPFSAVFLLGILWRRINGTGALATVWLGFAFGIVVKVWVNAGGAPAWLAPYSNQGLVNWAICMVLCTAISLVTVPPRPEQVTDDLTLNWRKMNIGGDLGNRWYNSVTLWWGLSVVLMIGFIFLFGVVL
ncbi:MAG: solute:Na+ symporter, family [Verrucomicrobiota bacterium]|nr:solute:Na+ symporter, family [Verrucomicrobiota bacterium]